MGGTNTNNKRRVARSHAQRIASLILTLLALVLVIGAGFSCSKSAYRNAGSIMLESGQDKKSMSPDEYSSGTASPPAPSMDRVASLPTNEGYYRVASTGSSSSTSLSSLFTQTAFAQETTAGVKPMIVYNGTLAIKVAKLKDASDSVLNILDKYRGYVSSMSENTQGTMQIVTITARVDAGKVMSFIAEVKKVGEVLSSDLTGDEVTEEYVDLQGQLSGLKAAEARLKDLLSKTGKLSDLLEVARELKNNQIEIDRVTGRMKYLKDRSARATVEITLQTEAPPPPSTIQFAWGFGEVFQQAWVNLKYTVRSFIAGVITFAVSALFWLPALVFIILVLIGVWRWLRRKGIIVWADEKKE